MKSGFEVPSGDLGDGKMSMPETFHPGVEGSTPSGLTRIFCFVSSGSALFETPGPVWFNTCETLRVLPFILGDSAATVGVPSLTRNSQTIAERAPQLEKCGKVDIALQECLRGCEL